MNLSQFPKTARRGPTAPAINTPLKYCRSQGRKAESAGVVEYGWGAKVAIGRLLVTAESARTRMAASFGGSKAHAQPNPLSYGQRDQVRGVGTARPHKMPQPAAIGDEPSAPLLMR